jgi:hypothetical protein
MTADIFTPIIYYSPLVLQAVKWTAMVWDGTTDTTIKNCWRKTQILPASWNASTSSPPEDQLRADAADLDGLIQNLGLGEDALTAGDYVQMPSENQVEEELTTEELIDAVIVSSSYCNMLLTWMSG